MENKFTKEALVAMAMAFGNYRAAISAVSAADEGHEHVVHTGKALLALQEYMGVEVADPRHVRIAVEQCRAVVLDE